MIHKCLFPVAGYGTRFLPATKSSPKEMLPVVNKPLIEYAVEEAVGAGLTRMGFVTGRGKRAIEDHFDTNYELEDQIRGTGKEDLIRPTRELIEACEFSYTRQKEMKGLGHAVLTGETLIGDEPFAVVLADDLCITDDDGVLTQMVKLFRQFRCSIVAVERSLMIISTNTEWSLASWLKMASTGLQIWSRSQLGIRPRRTWVLLAGTS